MGHRMCDLRLRKFHVTFSFTSPHLRLSIPEATSTRATVPLRAARRRPLPLDSPCWRVSTASALLLPLSPDAGACRAAVRWLPSVRRRPSLSSSMPPRASRAGRTRPPTEDTDTDTVHPRCCCLLPIGVLDSTWHGFPSFQFGGLDCTDSHCLDE